MRDYLGIIIVLIKLLKKIYFKVRDRKIILNKYIRVVFKKLKKYYKIIFLLIYFILRREIYIEYNTLIIIIRDILL